MPRTRFVWHLFAGWCALAATVCGGCFWLASVELARLADQSQLRRMTDAAFRHVGLTPPARAEALFD